jgi:colanic acid/amylovoran biosynthesis protein
MNMNKRVLLLGLTGGGELGGYETQLGNVAILIPVLRMLRQHIPDIEVFTTIQLTDKFCSEHHVTRIPNPRRIPSRIARAGFNLIRYLSDLLRARLWRFARDSFNLSLGPLIAGRRLKQFASADVVLDFNGDIFPSDLHPFLVFLHAIEIVTIRQLGIPIVEFISSPGPFDTWFRREVSKFMFKRIAVFANRDPVSSELVRELGIRDKPIVNTACPAFLLEPVPAGRARQILVKENVEIDQTPLVGVTLAGYNLASERTWQQPKRFDDLKVYVPTIEFLLNDLGAVIIMLPHVYRMNPYTYGKEHINGPDYDILRYLFRMIDRGEYKGRIHLIEGKYSASEAKGMIGQCDLYISGRLHAGVAALSQAIPTILLAYGHKHYGFARLVGQEEYVYGGNDAKALLSLTKDLWVNRDRITSEIRGQMKRVFELANLNGEIVKEILELSSNHSNGVLEDLSSLWVKKERDKFAKP